MYLTLNQVKKHLNIDEQFTDDDTYIQQLINVAENVVQQHIDRELSDFETVPTPLIHAALLLIGNYYANRESVTFASSQPLPHAYEYLIALWKNYNGDTNGTSIITD